MVLQKIDFLGNLNVSFLNLNSSNLILKLDEKNICVSSGSACSSCSSCNANPSHVLKAINVPDEYINSAIRTSFSDFNTFEEIDYFVSMLKNLIK